MKQFFILASLLQRSNFTHQAAKSIPYCQIYVLLTHLTDLLCPHCHRLLLASHKESHSFALTLQPFPSQKISEPLLTPQARPWSSRSSSILCKYDESSVPWWGSCMKAAYLEQGREASQTQNERKKCKWTMSTTRGRERRRDDDRQNISKEWSHLVASRCKKTFFHLSAT